MKKNKSFIIIAILFLSIGFAAVSTTLIINGTINIGTNEEDFDVYFSDAYLDGKQDLNIISNDGLSITYETANLSKVGDKSILEYVITNASTQYDANVSVTCTPNETETYKVINTQDKEIIEARSTGNGTVTVELKKNVLESQQINFTCTITANALERERANDVALPTDDTYVLEGTYVDSTGKSISKANLVVYSDTPHYVTTDANGNLLVSNLERGSHEIYHINDTLENIKNMTKEEVISKATTKSTFKTSDNNIIFTNNSSISSTILPNKEYCSSIVGKVYGFDYTGGEQEFSTICKGEYKIELWGASGGDIRGFIGGKGAYVSGIIYFEENTHAYLYVGGAGANSDIGGYNGGGYLLAGQSAYGASGGGATDVRLINGKWDILEGLKSRIMVAAGGGGANNRGQGYGDGNGGDGGTLIGIAGVSVNHTNGYGYGYGMGGTQTAGGKHIYIPGTNAGYGSLHGTFGSGGGLNQGASQSGGGSGYYGGGGSGHGGSGGGSSFISGYLGCDAINPSGIHTNQPNHYSGLIFTNAKMIAGNASMPSHDGISSMTGNTGNGYAKITYLG